MTTNRSPCARGTVYSIIYIPMHLVFPELRLLNPNWMHIDVLLDALFTVDVFVKIRTTYVDHGYNIANPRKIALRYLKSWFVIDFFSSLPFDWMLELAQIPGANGIQCASALEPPSPTDSWCAGQLVKLLALLRVGRLIRASDGGEGSGGGVGAMRIVYFIVGFVVIGHWLGLAWYQLAIAPIQEVSREASPIMQPSMKATYCQVVSTHMAILDMEPARRGDGLRGWLRRRKDTVHWLFTRYACSLYWALTVMTALKSLEAHESRMCFVADPLWLPVTSPLYERIYTIIVFMWARLCTLSSTATSASSFATSTRRDCAIASG